VNARVAILLILVLSALVRPARAADDDVTVQARTHYDVGFKLFDAGSHEQALIEFERANELKSRPATLFMMAQCEYLLGRLKEARVHYERYITELPTGEFAGLAKDRIESIDKRPSTFVINTVPDDVTVHIAPDGAAGVPVVGQAPNNFQVPRGRYRIDVTKPKYQGQTRIVDVDIAETKPLFFKLDPIPARLEIETTPAGATLYVNGNRARNPYRQDVVPGRYEIFAEAPDYTASTTEFTLEPGDRRLLLGPNRLALPYVQRSGRPELLVASGIIGAFVGAGAVAAGIGKSWANQDVGTVSLSLGGGFAGAVAGSLVATRIVPRYIPDNRALFILGAMWIGGVEGATTGIVWRQAHPVFVPNPNITVANPNPTIPNPNPTGDELSAAFLGSLPGLGLGLATGALFAKKAPTYGRVSLIQSAALGGAAAGALVQIATQWRPYGAENKKFLELTPGMLIGLNVGLASGLLGAYLPDQTRYGPSWQRVLLIDLAGVAGAVAGGVAGCVSDVDGCLQPPSATDTARARAALSALIGGAIGFGAGWALTRHVDDDIQQRPLPAPAPSTSVAASVMPISAPDGTTTPGLAAFGTF
jgi:hypothetical protein